MCLKAVIFMTSLTTISLLYKVIETQIMIHNAKKYLLNLTVGLIMTKNDESFKNP